MSLGCRLPVKNGCMVLPDSRFEAEGLLAMIHGLLGEISPLSFCFHHALSLSLALSGLCSLKPARTPHAGACARLAARRRARLALRAWAWSSDNLIVFRV